MFMTFFLFLAALFLAYANGANDNFKGVASLFGSRTTNYGVAIKWATVTTFAGSVCSVIFAAALVKTFTGKGLVPDELTVSPVFLLSVSLGAALTVIMATFTGFPISTTHSITGALIGAGFAAVGMGMHFSALLDKFLLPLVLSPVLAMTLSGLSYLTLRFFRLKLGVTEEWTLYVDQQAGLVRTAAPVSADKVNALHRVALEPLNDIRDEKYARQYTGSFLGIPVQDLLDKAHFLTAGLVSFARGLNDTPKIAALMLLVHALNLRWGVAALGIAMALGGLLNARKVAETMSNKITSLNHGQGFTANLITGFLVIFASRMGMPVSTTHVSVGALSGIGLLTRQANTGVLSGIFLSWVLTLPIAGVLAWGIYSLAPRLLN